VPQTVPVRVSVPTPVPVETQHVPFADLRGRTSDLSGIDQVIAPLFGKGFDGFELIPMLAASGFQGRLSLTASALPNRGMVLRELRALAQPFGIMVELPQSRA
jgi:hypothetical protein